MAQTWLKPNRRVLGWGMVPPVIVTAMGVWLAAVTSDAGPLRWSGFVLAAVGLILVLLLARQTMLPRMAFDEGNLLVYLSGGAPQSVPIDVVEVFFLGQKEFTGHTFASGSKTSAIVIRLAESATEWKSRDVKPRLGMWSDGYITILGIWCEPISPGLVEQLNKKLIEVHRARRKCKSGN